MQTPKIRFIQSSPRTRRWRKMNIWRRRVFRGDIELCYPEYMANQIQLSYLFSDKYLASAKIVPSGCWEWKGNFNSSGYAELSHRPANQKGTFILGHRYAYELFIGPLDLSLVLDHTCNNRGCVNPYHLEQVTHAENMRRMGARKTHCKRGHERTEKNTHVTVTGTKRCRPCGALLAKQYKRARKSASNSKG